MIRNARFRALVLLLLVALTTSPAIAAGPAPAKPKAPALVTWLWQALDRLVPGLAKGGKIAASLGDLAGAESIFGQLWEEFRVRDLNQEVVLVSIDLAEVLTWKGDVARAAELAAQCYSIMKNWGLHRDALSAWLVLQKTLAQGQGIGDIFQRIEQYYRRHWVRPAVFQ